MFGLAPHPRYARSLASFGHGLLVCGSLAVSLAPAAGQPVALWSLHGEAQRLLPQLLIDPKVQLLGTVGQGSIPVIVRGEASAFEILFRHGVLMVPTTAPDCDPASGEPR